MTLQDLGNLGEILGAIAVVVSLIYLSVQIRQNTRALQNSTFHEVVRDQTTGIDQLNHDPELNRIFYDGLRDFESLSLEERRRFATYLTSVIRRLENMHYQTRQGILEASAWSGIREHMRYLLSQPGAAAWWNRSRNLFQPELASFIDDGLP